MASTIGPSYRHVADDIKERITAAEFPVGQPIPSTARLMEHYGVSSTVVRRAVAELQAEGIVIGHSGKAVFVRARPSDAEAERTDVGRLAAEVAELRAVVGRLEANLMDLYGRSGYEYPHEEAGVGQGESGRRERLA